jgi:hypothetical protein
MKVLCAVLLLCAACVPSVESFDGYYTFANELKGLDHRNWNAEYWILEVNGDKGRLSFTDAARGLYSFDLSVSVQPIENKISVHFDSLNRDAMMDGQKLDTLQKGEKLLEMVRKNGDYSIPFEKITQLQYKELKRGIVKVERVEPTE